MLQLRTFFARLKTSPLAPFLASLILLIASMSYAQRAVAPPTSIENSSASEADEPPMEDADTASSRQPASTRPINEATALVLARTAETQTGIPIAINDRVLYWLNKSTQTASARRTMRTRLKRMNTYRSMIEQRLEDRRLPSALLAIPILESGYVNFRKHQIAGLWSFMRQTARNFGLKVNSKVDERLDPAKSSAAAVAYFEKLYKMFDDWNLALLAYNAGEQAVQNIVDKAGHRDVFRFADEGLLKRKVNRDYVPKFLATVIIMAHPELVD